MRGLSSSAGKSGRQFDQGDFHRIAEPAFGLGGGRLEALAPAGDFGEPAVCFVVLRRQFCRGCRSKATGSTRSFSNMRFSVSVPVLSVQMTSAEPSVSTAGRWRISTLRAAIRCAPKASDNVTVGSRPSGTLATMIPMANRKHLP